jgi:hypothetical protein
MLSSNQPTKRVQHIVWAMLIVDSQSEASIRDFFTGRLGISSRFVHRNLHLILYHARRRIEGLKDRNEPVSIEVPAGDWRFMAVAPGGENRRPEIDASRRRIAIRVRRSTDGARRMLQQRERFYVYETPDVLGNRRPSTATRSAFGAHSYQPHVTVLYGKSGLDSDLSKAGELFRDMMPPVHFDRLIVRRRVEAEYIEATPAEAAAG